MEEETQTKLEDRVVVRGPLESVIREGDSA